MSSHLNCFEDIRSSGDYTEVSKALTSHDEPDHYVKENSSLDSATDFSPKLLIGRTESDVGNKRFLSHKYKKTWRIKNKTDDPLKILLCVDTAGNSKRKSRSIRRSCRMNSKERSSPKEEKCKNIYNAVVESALCNEDMNDKSKEKEAENGEKKEVPSCEVLFINTYLCGTKIVVVDCTSYKYDPSRLQNEKCERISPATKNSSRRICVALASIQNPDDSASIHHVEPYCYHINHSFKPVISCFLNPSSFAQAFRDSAAQETCTNIPKDSSLLRALYDACSGVINDRSPPMKEKSEELDVTYMTSPGRYMDKEFTLVNEDSFSSPSKSTKHSLSLCSHCNADSVVCTNTGCPCSTLHLLLDDSASECNFDICSSDVIPKGKLLTLHIYVNSNRCDNSACLNEEVRSEMGSCIKQKDSSINIIKVEEPADLMKGKTRDSGGVGVEDSEHMSIPSAVELMPNNMNVENKENSFLSNAWQCKSKQEEHPHSTQDVIIISDGDENDVGLKNDNFTLDHMVEEKSVSSVAQNGCILETIIIDSDVEDDEAAISNKVTTDKSTFDANSKLGECPPAKRTPDIIVRNEEANNAAEDVVIGSVNTHHLSNQEENVNQLSNCNKTKPVQFGDTHILESILSKRVCKSSRGDQKSKRKGKRVTSLMLGSLEYLKEKTGVRSTKEKSSNDTNAFNSYGNDSQNNFQQVPDAPAKLPIPRLHSRSSYLQHVGKTTNTSTVAGTKSNYVPKKYNPSGMCGTSENVCVGSKCPLSFPSLSVFYRMAMILHHTPLPLFTPRALHPTSASNTRFLSSAVSNLRPATSSVSLPSAGESAFQPPPKKYPKLSSPGATYPPFGQQVQYEQDATFGKYTENTLMGATPSYLNSLLPTENVTNNEAFYGFNPALASNGIICENQGFSSSDTIDFINHLCNTPLSDPFPWTSVTESDCLPHVGFNTLYPQYGCEFIDKYQENVYVPTTKDQVSQYVDTVSQVKQSCSKSSCGSTGSLGSTLPVNNIEKPDVGSSSKIWHPLLGRVEMNTVNDINK